MSSQSPSHNKSAPTLNASMSQNQRKKNNKKKSPNESTPILTQRSASWYAREKMRDSGYGVVDSFDPNLSHVSADLKSLLQLKDHRELFIDREVSWLEFNRRVLEEAEDTRNPLLERAKFLAIFSTNLDEFYMIRLSGILKQVNQGVLQPALGGSTPEEEIEIIDKIIAPMLQRQWKCWSEVVRPELEENRIVIVNYDNLTAEEKLGVTRFFESAILPVLTPLMVDPTHPFPFISNLSINFAVILKRDKEGSTERHFARLKIPSAMKRFIRIDEEERICPMKEKDDDELPSTRLLLLEDCIRANLGMLFPGMIVEEAHLFRVTRDADVEIAEDEAGDLLETMEKATRQRKFGHVVKVVVQPGAMQSVSQLLIDAFEIDSSQLEQLDFFGYASLWELASLPRPELQFQPFVPRVPEMIQRHNNDVFAAMREGDILLHHPYDSFQPVVQFFAQAARDPTVVAVKATLYRVGPNSPIVANLLEAAQNEKEVTVLVELKARFDEKNNITWAKTLEAAGVHVVYGVKSLKTHAKLGLVIRKEGHVLRPYVHMSTGNYNHSTAKFYTDLGFFTIREDIGSDMIRLFNRLSAIAPGTVYTRLCVAPEFLRSSIYKLIDREIKNKRSGKEAQIRIKCNSITDPAMITKLYEASFSGVKIDLLVRGVCCLRPGVKDISENISVTSLVGRLLEHSRVFEFHNDGTTEIYIGSADLMGRNLDRRVENFFPILDPTNIAWIQKWVFNLQLADNSKKRTLHPDGTWKKDKVDPDVPIVNSQEVAIQGLTKKMEDFVDRSTKPQDHSLKRLVKAATKRLV